MVVRVFLGLRHTMFGDQRFQRRHVHNTRCTARESPGQVQRKLASEFAIKTFAGTITIHRGKQNFSRPTALSFLRPLKRAAVPRLHAEIQAADLVAGAAQRGRRRGDVQRLVAQFVGRDKQDTHN